MHAIVYGWSTCGHCERARQLLELHGVEHRMEFLDDRRAQFERIQKLYGRATAPIVLLEGELVGGLEELEQLALEGALGPARTEGTEAEDAR